MDTPLRYEKHENTSSSNSRIGFSNKKIKTLFGESKIKVPRDREASFNPMIKVKGIWCYLYRAVDKLGNTVDFLLTRKRQRMSAQSFLIKAINNNCRPRVINIDKSCSNTAAIKVYNKRSF